MSKKASKKKVKNLRNVAMLLLVSVLMLSAATYAWFTTSTSANLTNLTMNVASGGGGLLFCERTDSSGTLSAYTSVLNLSNVLGAVPQATTDGAIYYPATAAKELTAASNLTVPQNGRYADGKRLILSKPVYDTTGLSVTGVTPLASNTDESGNIYYYEATFLVKIPDGDGTSTQAVYLAPKKGEAGSETGTYVKSGDGNIAPEAIRVAFTINDGTTKTAVYEYLGPNTTREEGTYAAETGDLSAYGTYNTLKQNTDGKFVDNNYKLFDMTAGTNVPMTVQIWFEGRDTQCNNVISGKNITGNFEFVTEDPAGTPAQP